MIMVRDRVRVGVRVMIMVRDRVRVGDSDYGIKYVR